MCRGPGDGFVVVWNVDEVTTVRRFDAQGLAQGTDVSLVQVNNPKCCGGDSSFVVVGWQGSFQTGSPEVLAQRFSGSGALAGTQFMVNSYTTGKQSSAAVACNAAGRFVVAWTNYSYDDITEIEDDDIFARTFNSSANPVGTEFQVNTYTTETSSNASAATDPNGDLVIAWHTRNDGDDDGISAQRYSLGTLPTTTTTTLPPTTTTTTLPPAGTCGDPVAFSVLLLGEAPRSNNVTASDALFALKTAVGAQACELCICDVDRSGSVSATDALIILKFAVGQSVTIDCVPC